ncbi:hypothetical protein AWB99_18875 [Mycolicibacterium confluentis]|nr:hypothetical protein [Mycolicibacterium confluentis]ORV28241.1 hypothetical protein AWB99_18875 [Mycolicibacterium confluentis]
MGLALLAVTAGTSSACGSGGDDEIDPLQEPYETAVADAEMARSAATAATPAIARALTQIASERAQHAQALADELARESGQPAPTTTTETTTSTAAGATGSAPPPPSPSDVAMMLRRSGENAAAVAASQSGYRAGLLASIAAACTASVTVTLPQEKAGS